MVESGVAPIFTTVKNKKNENSKKRKKTKRGDGRVRRCVPKGKIKQEGGYASCPFAIHTIAVCWAVSAANRRYARAIWKQRKIYLLHDVLGFQR